MSMEPRLLSGDTIIEVWSEAFRLLADDRARFNLTLHVRQPLAYTQPRLAALNPRGVDRNARSVFDVASTIFPARCARWDLPVAEFTEHYREAYERLLSRGPRSWGCYFSRLAEFGDEKIDQLERTVAGLSTWGWGHKAAFVVHFSSSATDKLKWFGAPCLQYAQFSVGPDRALSLTAVYRSHDYFYKTLGNLLGLSRLLDYVACKTAHPVGSLTCLSAYAFVDASRAKVTALLNKANGNRIIV
ncbi:hypothetical protein [Panacagrimonas sp.]|uniref:hypothetical protein n=1 Tax=Panacagrimonas sp. TaxID=2480088 RepID=UPI003B516FE4